MKRSRVRPHSHHGCLRVVWLEVGPRLSCVRPKRNFPSARKLNGFPRTPYGSQVESNIRSRSIRTRDVRVNHTALYGRGNFAQEGAQVLRRAQCIVRRPRNMVSDMMRV